MNRDALRGESIYCIFPRNHSTTGDLPGVIKDLDRIKDLGITTIWLMPHYPIGKKNRKGVDGSPYSISDYYSVNPELGGLNDFKQLLSECHNRELKLIIDIVFNHTSCDSELVNEHSEWFFKDGKGNPMSKILNWDDVYDLDFDNYALRNYLIDVLQYWADLGVDGFRCDLASITPLSFWKMAKDTLSGKYSNLIWLGESGDKEFISFVRHKGYTCLSDSELYTVFDILYDYDIQNIMVDYINRERDFNSFVESRKEQEVIYPVDYLKLRFLENHELKLRASELLTDKFLHLNWKAFSMFEKGVPLIYAGEEYRIEKIPDMYKRDPIDWNNSDREFSGYISKLLKIEHMYIVTNGIYTVHPLADDCIHLKYRFNGETLHGIFNFGEKERTITIEVLVGSYLNIITGKEFKIENEELDLSKAPYIFKSVP